MGSPGRRGICHQQAAALDARYVAMGSKKCPPQGESRWKKGDLLGMGTGTGNSDGGPLVRGRMCHGPTCV